LAQAYSNDPISAISDAIKWTRNLRNKDYVVLSPILHTHHYHIANLKLNPDHTDDYVAWDLALLAAMCLPLFTFDAGLHLETCVVTMDKTPLDYQPLITMLFAPTCFSFPTEFLLNHDDLFDLMTFDTTWESKGAQREYQFAKTHHIKCLLLEPFLAGKEVLL
jgi:hypothetical protein